MGLAFAGALLVRLVYLLSFRHSAFFATPIVDAAWHDEWAWAWAQGRWSMGETAFFRAPFYPFWLSLLYRIVGHAPLAVRVAQSILGAGAAAALAGIGWRLDGRRTALWAGGIAAVYGPLVFFDNELLIEGLLAVLIAWALFCLSWPHPADGGGPGNSATGPAGAGKPGRPGAARPRPARIQLLGMLLLGLAVIARPNALVLVPAALVFIAGWRVADIRRSWRLAVAGAALALLPALVVTALNYRAEGTPVFIASQGGVNFYAGNHAGASGRSVEIPELAGAGSGWREFVAASRRVAEEAAGHPLDSGEVDRYWSRRAWRWILSSPGEALGLPLRKAYYLVNAFEIPNNRSIYFERPGLLKLLVWKTPFFAFPWGIVFPLAVAGAFVGLRRGPARPLALLLVAAALLYGLALIPFFICDRLRLGLVPALIPLAALALSRPGESFRGRPLLAGVAALLLVNSTLFQVRRENPAQELARLGAVLLEQGRVEAGRAALEKAHQVNPQDGSIAYLLGLEYADEGRNEDAVRMYRRSLELAPNDGQVLSDLGAALVRLGRYQEVRPVLEQAAARAPRSGDIRALAGLVYERLGDTAKAEAAYLDAIHVDPASPSGYLGLGTLRRQRGDLVGAIATWREGANRNAGSFELHYNLALACEQTGDAAEGLKEIEAALNLRPADRDAQRVRARLLNPTGEPGRM